MIRRGYDEIVAVEPAGADGGKEVSLPVAQVPAMLDVPAADLPPDTGTWVADDPDLTARVEDGLATSAGLPPGGVLVDFPRKPAMLTSDVPVLTRDGAVAPARLGLQRIAEDLHTTARRLRVYVAEPRELDAGPLLELVTAPAAEVRERVGADSGG